MDGPNPKFSFIPKGSLVREDSFLERRRPKSFIGFVAAIIFVSSAGAYATLYYFNDSFNKIIASKKVEIEEAKEEFNSSPEVGEARIFRARADLAHELLNTHRVTSPVFTFLSDNTLESIMYEKFSFMVKHGGAVVVLGGEAESYASLAYQSDVLKTKEKELLSFSVRDMTLTKFGTITFTLELVFKPDYLLYTKNLAGKHKKKEPVVNAEAKSAVAARTKVSTETAQTDISKNDSAVPEVETADVIVSDDALVEKVSLVEDTTDTEQKMSVLRQLWLRFKFW